MSLYEDNGHNHLSQTEKELENQINDLENRPIWKSPEKKQRIEEIKKFISDNRNKLNLTRLDRTLEGRAKQLVSQTEGFRSWFVSPSRKEEILEEAQFLENLRVSTADARSKLKEEQAKKANYKLAALIDSFYFTDHDKNTSFNPEQEDEFLKTGEVKSYLILITDLIQEKEKDIYVKMIHFILNNKNVLDNDTLRSFTQQLDNRIKKIECIIKNKAKVEELYPDLCSDFSFPEEFLNSSRLKSKVTSLKDLRDLTTFQV